MTLYLEEAIANQIKHGRGAKTAYYKMLVHLFKKLNKHVDKIGGAWDLGKFERDYTKTFGQCWAKSRMDAIIVPGVQFPRKVKRYDDTRGIYEI